MRGRRKGKASAAVLDLALVGALAIVSACASTSQSSNASSDGGSICSSAGRTWTAQPSFSTADLVSVFEPAAADVWIGGDRLVRSQGGGPFVPICVASFCGGGEMPGSCGPMAPVECRDAGEAPLVGSGIWGTSGDDVWTGGMNRATVHWDGTNFTSFFAGDNRTAGAFWGTSSTDVWGVDVTGNGYRGHWDGGSWSHQSNLTGGAVWGADPAHYWVAMPGYRQARQLADPSTPGRVELWAGDGDPVTVLSTTTPLSGVWGSSRVDVWVVGLGGAIEHWDGSSWSAAASPTSHDLYAVWGHHAADVWAVGASGTIVHFDGASWSLAPSPTSNDLYAVAGLCGDAWAVGASGTLLALR